MPNVNPLMLLGQIFAPRTTAGVRGYLDTLAEKRLKSFFEEPERFKGVGQVQPGQEELSAYRRLSGGRDWPMIESETGIYPSEPVEEPRYAMPKSVEEMTLEQAGLKGRAAGTTSVSQKQTELEGAPGLYQQQMSNLRDLYTPEELGELSIKDIISGVERWTEPEEIGETGAYGQTLRSSGAIKALTSRPSAGAQKDPELDWAMEIVKLSTGKTPDNNTMMMLNIMSQTNPKMANDLMQGIRQGTLPPDVIEKAYQIIRSKRGLKQQSGSSAHQSFKRSLGLETPSMQPGYAVSP